MVCYLCTRNRFCSMQKAAAILLQTVGSDAGQENNTSEGDDPGC